MPAQTPKKETPSGSTLTLVGFFLGQEEYALDILKIREIRPMMEITTVPKAPDFVEGVINLRGDIVPIINLRAKLSLPEAEHTEESKVIVVEFDNRLIGIVVDEVSEVIEIPEERVSPPPAIIGGVEAEFLKGVGKLGDRLLILLDLDKILTEKEKKML